MGIQGVTFPIGYPLYSEDDPHHSEYVQFFKQVVQEIRKRGMKLDIESAVLFANTPFSSISENFTGLTFDQFKISKAKMVAEIINDLHPDYLNLGCEPDTMAALTGLKEFNDPAKYIDYVNYVLQNVTRGSTKIMAGIGTWDDISYVRDLLTQTNIDCVAIHIYPVIGEGLTKAISVISLAAQYNKHVVLDECWLYKTDTLSIGGIAASSNIYRLDSFSFFTPLDEEFFSEIVSLTGQAASNIFRHSGPVSSSETSTTAPRTPIFPIHKPSPCPTRRRHRPCGRTTSRLWVIFTGN